MEGTKYVLEVTDIQRGCTHDGPGLRTTVFLKGCPLRCKWCHNPETQRVEKEIFFYQDKCRKCMHCVEICPAGAHQNIDGEHIFEADKCIGCMACVMDCGWGALTSVSRTMTVEEVLNEVVLDKVFYRRRGGLTVSGGEPTLQKEALLALLKAAKAEGVSTCLETCGVFSKDMVPQLLECVDLFLYDMKDTDPSRLKDNTGAGLELVKDNLLRIDQGGGKSVLRCILIPDVNMTTEHGEALKEMFEKLNHCQYIELLPYHPYGLAKSEQLGIEGVRYRQPDKEEVCAFADMLVKWQVPVKLYGTMYEG